MRFTHAICIAFGKFFCLVRFLFPDYTNLDLHDFFSMDGWWMEWSKTYIQNHWDDFHPTFFQIDQTRFQAQYHVGLDSYGAVGAGDGKKHTPILCITSCFERIFNGDVSCVIPPSLFRGSDGFQGPGPTFDESSVTTQFHYINKASFTKFDWNYKQMNHQNHQTPLVWGESCSSRIVWPGIWVTSSQ